MNAQRVSAGRGVDAKGVVCCSAEQWDKHSTRTDKTAAPRSNPPLVQLALALAAQASRP